MYEFIPEGDQGQTVSCTRVHPYESSGTLQLSSEPVGRLGDALHNGPESGLSVSNQNVVLSNDLRGRLGEIEGERGLETKRSESGRVG